MLSGIGGSTSDCGGVDADSVESDIGLTRSGREKVVNNRLAHTTELYLFALVQFTITADTDVFFLAFRRRFLFRSAPANNANNQNNGACDPNRPAPIPLAHTCTTLYDHLSHQTLATIEWLLFSLSHETAKIVRKTTINTIYNVGNQGMPRGRP
ncbi:hypothetical protein D9613_004906 [Agrocybe pediades]|uniref:Uncharacterized protein n=1 Tax=Agrocybe pediades TaxID=84607 RepID=A0A8H4QYJ0_9AGAR|nr:hypothetical protein D9613_004906 [Agrocybe pediades]